MPLISLRVCNRIRKQKFLKPDFVIGWKQFFFFCLRILVQTFFKIKSEVYLQVRSIEQPAPYFSTRNRKQKRTNTMKTKLMLVVAISLMGSAAFAQESASPKFVVVNQGNPAIYKVVYNNPGATRVKMNVYKGTGEKVYSESVNVDGFVRSLNFKSMTTGVYTVEMSDNTGKYAQKVNYVHAKPSNIHVARIAKDSNKYLLSVANEANAEINVRILDGDNNLVHTQSLAVNGSVGLVYDLASVNGNPTFEVTDGSGGIRTIKY